MPAYDPNNIFAKILRGELPCYKVYEDDKALGFLDIMPRATGHALVLPKVAARNLLDIAPDDLAHVAKTVQRVAKAAMTVFAADGVTVPRQYVKDGKIVLNVSFSATQMLKLGNDFVSFEARFGGVGFAVQVPVRAILGIYARETGQGMIFPEGDADPDPTDSPPATPGNGKPSAAATKRPKLQVVK